MHLIASILSFYFFGLALLPHIDPCEIRKLPALWSHYEQHKNMDGDSFLEFLMEDYLSQQGDEEGHHSSSPDNLPFQSHVSHCHCFNLNFVTNSFHLPKNREAEVENFASASHSYVSLFLDTLFQPPQV